MITPDSILVTLSAAVLTGMSGAIGVLFNMVVKEKAQNRLDFEKCRADFEECRKDRENLHGRVHELCDLLVELRTKLGQ